MSARFLIAKFAPDLKRMEPRNIGVIVWVDGIMGARFIGEDAALEVPAVPHRIGVEDRKNYREWIGSWRRQISKTYIDVDRGEPVSRLSPEFVDHLKSWSRGNYMLVDGGFIAEPVASAEVNDLTEYLFRELVAIPTDDGETVEREYVRLKAHATHALKKSGILSRPDIQTNWPGIVEIHSVSKSFEFNYAIGPLAAPYSFYHRVPLGHQKTFDSLVLNLDAFRRTKRFGKNRLCALVIGDRASLTTTQHEDNLKIIDDVCTVVDVTDESAAMHKLQEIALLNGQDVAT